MTQDPTVKLELKHRHKVLKVLARPESFFTKNDHSSTAEPPAVRYNKWLHKCEDMIQQLAAKTNVVHLFFLFCIDFCIFSITKKMASQLEDMIQQLTATHEQQLAATPNVLHLFFLFPYTFRIFIKYNKWLYKCEDMMQQQQQLTNSNVVHLFFLFHTFSVFFKIQHWLHKCEDMMLQLASTHEQQLAANTNVV